mgnify:CR=1 FL=1
MTKADLLEVINDFGDDTEIKVNDKEIKEMKISRKDGKVFVELITDGMDQD